MQTADVINQLAAFPSKRAHSEDVHEAARSEVLSKLPPRQVLNLFYSRKLSLQRPAVVTGIRSRFKTRKELLTWVYRDDRLFQDVNYVRLPSLEKRILVSRLVGYAQKRFGIYRNAAAHLGQQYVASFDLADFFPSVKVADIIPALLAIKTPMVLKSPDAESPEAVPFAWTHDAAVFIARLVTHRGQLPQGAPTSPAIANLVFQAYDHRILERLGADFVYTRYVDDIAISISASASLRVGIRSIAAMRRHVQSVLNDVLAKSNFRFNPRKTKVSDLSSGHHITGLRVSKEEISLPRKARRRIRSLLYRIREHGFVKTASELIGGEVHAQTVYRNELSHYARWGHILSNHRNDHHREGRRLSTERLAILMLKQFHPHIYIEVPDAVRYIDGDRIKRPQELHDGKKAWRDVELFLPGLWESHLSVEEDEAHTVVKHADGTVLCRMRSEKALAFFHLPKREAISTVELWHHLRGLSAGLLVQDGDRCFEPIRKLQKEIDSKALASSVFQLLRILADRVDGRRFPVYELEKRYIGSARIQRPQIEQLDDDDALPMQRQILSSLAEVMNESVRHCRQMMHPDEWIKSLAANEFWLSLDEQLVAETNRFIELRDRAVWPDDGKRVFSDDVNSQVTDHAGELAKSIANGQWTTVWKRLFEFGHMIISVTTDSGASQSGSDFLERFNAVLAKDQSDFAVILHLRHRKAHGVSYTGLKEDSKKKIHGEWLTSQRWAKRYLGRRWSWNEKTGPRTVFFDDERDMRLTPLEGTEVKLALLVAVNRCLEKFRKVE